MDVNTLKKRPDDKEFQCGNNMNHQSGDVFNLPAIGEDENDNNSVHKANDPTNNAISGDAFDRTKIQTSNKGCPSFMEDTPEVRNFSSSMTEAKPLHHMLVQYKRRTNSDLLGNHGAVNPSFMRGRVDSLGGVYKPFKKSDLLFPRSLTDANSMASRSRTESCSSTFNKSRTDENFSKLKNLQLLYEEGFITNTEFKDRRSQLVDELTGTSKSKSKSRASWGQSLPRPMAPILYHEPPNWSRISVEEAIKHEFDYDARTWSTTPIHVKIDPAPFAKGGLRMVYHLQDLTDTSKAYVAKVAIDPNEEDETYFRDVEMQAVAADYAHLYNSYHPPRRVEFIQAWILQLVSRDRDGLLCGVEPFIKGDYQKHNNNCGYVSELERNTPQAFSHFTLEASNHEILVVDIQGVGDHYTDPQIHTRSGEEFGKGNLSVRGFEKFLSSHRCNPICRYLRIPLINPKDTYSKGTVPAQTYMRKAKLDRVTSELRHYYGDSSGFQNHHKRHSSNQGMESINGTTKNEMDVHFCSNRKDAARKEDSLTTAEGYESMGWCGMEQNCSMQ